LGLVGNALLGVAVGALFISAAQGAITPRYTANGQIAVSADGAGSTAATYPIRAQKPSASATVRAAFLMAATVSGSSNSVTNTDVQLASSPVTFTTIVPGAITNTNYYAT
jgi:hypothetical protein